MLRRVQWLAVTGAIVVGVVLAVRPTCGEDPEFKAGDRAVTTEQTPVQATEGTVATLAPGVELKVVDVKQGWIGITAEQDGKKIAGWVKPSTLSHPAKSPVTNAFEQGYAHHLKGRLSQAIASYSEAIRLDPNHARAYNNRGLAYQANRDMRRAINDFTKAIQLAPTLSATYLNRGIAYASQRGFTKAIEDYSEAIRLDPENFKAYKRRAAAYVAKGENDKATADIMQAAKIYRPKHDTLAHKVIKIEMEVKDKDYAPNYEVLDSIIDEAKAKIHVEKPYTEGKAIEVFQIIDAILAKKRFVASPQGLTIDSLVPRTITREMLKAINPAVLRFRARPGENVYFSHPLATCLIYASIGESLGLPIQVALVPGHCYIRWDITDSSHVNWEPAIGAVKTDHELVARNEISVDAFRNGLYLSPLSQDEILACVFTNLAQVWMGEWYGLENEYNLNLRKIAQDDKSGKNQQDSKKEQAPKSLSEEDKKANVAERHAKAIDALTKAIDLNRKAYESYLKRGAYWGMVGEHDKAITDNSMAIQLDPNQPAPYYSRGVARVSRGDYKQAIGDFDKVLQVNSELPAAYYFRGVARAESNEFDLALKDLERAIRMEPQFIDAYRVRAKVYELLGQQNKADADLEKVKSLQQKR